MKDEHVVEQLKKAAEQIGWEVRFEKGNFRGGRCEVEGETVIILNKRHSPDVQLQILAECFEEVSLENLYLPPAVRSALEDAWARTNAG
jgi:hypothetical protein